MQFELKTKNADNYLDDWENIDAQPANFLTLESARKQLKLMIDALPGILEYRINEAGAPGGTYIAPDVYTHQSRLKEANERPIIGPTYSVAFVSNAASAQNDYQNRRSENDGMLSVDNAIELFGEHGLDVDDYGEAFVIAVKVAFARSIDFLIFMP